MVDDLKPNLGIFNDSYSKSPNIDQLGKLGMRFNYAYANQAVCVASRYNFMLGKRSTSTGLYRFGVNFREVYPEMETLPQLFKNNGYHAESIGKVYHEGHGNTNDEDSWSIPHHSEKVIEYIVPESNYEELTREEALFENYNLYAKDKIDIKKLPRGAAWEAPDVSDEAYADGRIARHAIERLRALGKGKNQPFFLAIGFIRPHLPFSVPKKYWDLYDKNQLPLPEYEISPLDAPSFAVKRGGEINNFKPIDPSSEMTDEEELKRNLIHGYYASISYMDRQLGRVMREIKNLGLDENTIIVLWGDHGWHLGEKQHWRKQALWEDTTHVPFIVSYPKKIAKNSICESPVSFIDIYPTLVDLAGIPKKEGLDGKSLKELQVNPSIEWNRPVLSTYGKGNHAVRSGKWRYIQYKDGSSELYDHQNDPN